VEIAWRLLKAQGWQATGKGGNQALTYKTQADRRKATPWIAPASAPSWGSSSFDAFSAMVRIPTPTLASHLGGCGPVQF
jgi:hypothetical protein